MTPIEIVADVSRRLTARSIRHLVGGSFASSAWGEVRATNDVDIAVLIGPHEAATLASAFESPYYASLESIQRALDEPGIYRSTHAIHMDEAFQIDLFLVRPDSYSITEFERVRPVEIVDGISVPFSAPENVVLQKLRWFDQANRVSDRQWNDVVRVLEIQRMKLDYAYLQHWAEELGVAELLAEALAQRIDEDPFA
jgi:hypothetical protein